MKNILAVVVGAAVTLAIWFGLDAVVFRSGAFPDSVDKMTTGHWLVPLVCRTVGVLVGGFVGMQIARARPVVTVGVGALAAAHAGVAIYAAATKSPDLGPVWFPVAVLLVCFPGVWAGTKLVRDRTPLG